MTRSYFLVVLMLSIFILPATMFGQSSMLNLDTTKYNRFLKVDVLGLSYHASKGFSQSQYGPSYLYLSVQYEAQLKRRQTFGVAIDYNELSRQIWIRPVWRFYHKEAFNNVFVGVYPAYVHVNGTYTGDYLGLGAIAGAQSRLGKRITLEFNLRYSRQFGSGTVYDPSTGKSTKSSDQFNAGTMELNIGYGIGRKH